MHRGLWLRVCVTTLLSSQKIVDLDVCDMCIVSFIYNFKYNKEKAKMLFWPKGKNSPKIVQNGRSSWCWCSPVMRHCFCLNCENGNRDRSKQNCCTSVFPATYRRDYLGASYVWTLKNYWNLSRKSFWSLRKWILYYYRLLCFHFNLILDFLSYNTHHPEKMWLLEELYLHVVCWSSCGENIKKQI